MNTTQTMYCSRGNSTSTDSMTCFFVSKKFRYDRGTGGDGVAQKTGKIEPSTNIVYTMVVSNNLSAGSAWLNGEKDVDLCNGMQQSFTPGSVLTIFQSHTTPVTTGSNWGTYRLYRFKVETEAGVVMRDLVPCYRLSDGAIGFYDVSGQSADPFYRNAGTGSFQKGSDVSSSGSLTIASDPADVIGVMTPEVGTTVLDAGAELACSAVSMTNSVRLYADICTGYKLEKFDPSGLVWTELYSASATQTNYVQHGSDRYRLTWQWEKRDVPGDATPRTWASAQDGAWATAANWTPEGRPTLATPVWFDVPGKYEVAVDDDAAANVELKPGVDVTWNVPAGKTLFMPSTTGIISITNNCSLTLTGGGTVDARYFPLAWHGDGANTRLTVKGGTRLKMKTHLTVCGNYSQGNDNAWSGHHNQVLVTGEGSSIAYDGTADQVNVVVGQTGVSNVLTVADGASLVGGVKLSLKVGSTANGNCGRTTAYNRLEFLSAAEQNFADLELGGHGHSQGLVVSNTTIGLTHSSSKFHLGYWGAGSNYVHILDGGVINHYNYDIYVGMGEAKGNEIVVRGKGSELRGHAYTWSGASAGNLRIGYSFEANRVTRDNRVLIEDGGLVTILGCVYVGGTCGSNSLLRVSNGSLVCVGNKNSKDSQVKVCNESEVVVAGTNGYVQTTSFALEDVSTLRLAPSGKDVVPIQVVKGATFSADSKLVFDASAFAQLQRGSDGFFTLMTYASRTGSALSNVSIVGCRASRVQFEETDTELRVCVKPKPGILLIFR